MPPMVTIEMIMVSAKEMAGEIREMDAEKLRDALLPDGRRREGFSSEGRHGQPGTPDTVCGGCGKKGLEHHQP